MPNEMAQLLKAAERIQADLGQIEEEITATEETWPEYPDIGARLDRLWSEHATTLERLQACGDRIREARQIGYIEEASEARHRTP